MKAKLHSPRRIFRGRHGKAKTGGEEKNANRTATCNLHKPSPVVQRISTSADTTSNGNEDGRATSAKAEKCAHNTLVKDDNVLASAPPPPRNHHSHKQAAAPTSTGDIDSVEEWTGVITLLNRSSLNDDGATSSSFHVRVGTADSSSSSFISFADNSGTKHSATTIPTIFENNAEAQFRHGLTERTATTAASTICTAPESSLSLASLTSLDASSSSAVSASTKNALLAPTNAPIAPTDWGFPGFLNSDEYATLVKFQSWIETSTAGDAATGKAITDAIFSFGGQEDYFHALCRWLRARKYNIADTIAMVKEAVAERTEGEDAPIHHNFYPSAKEALGVEESIYKTQYPQCFSGETTKDGKVLFFSKPGRVNINGLELVSTPAGVNRYQWSVMQHSFASTLRNNAAKNPSFIRYQSCVIMDLEGLSRATCNSRVLSIIQHQSRVDALCFPEILGRCLIINAPSFFSVVWSVIKRWLDARTASKIEIYSSKSKAITRLIELIEPEHLPREYGGLAPNVDEMIVQQGSGNADGNDTSGEKRGVIKRRATKLMHIKGGHVNMSVNVAAGEEMEVVVFTRSVGGALFIIERVDSGSAGDDCHRCPESSKLQNENIEAKKEDAQPHRSCLDSLPHPHVPHPHITMPHLPHLHHNHGSVIESTVRCPANRAQEDTPPYSQLIASGLNGPGRTYRISGQAINKSKDYHLVVCNIFDKTP